MVLKDMNLYTYRSEKDQNSDRVKTYSLVGAELETTDPKEFTVIVNDPSHPRLLFKCEKETESENWTNALRGVLYKSSSPPHTEVGDNFAVEAMSVVPEATRVEMYQWNSKFQDHLTRLFASLKDPEERTQAARSLNKHIQAFVKEAEKVARAMVMEYTVRELHRSVAIPSDMTLGPEGSFYFRNGIMFKFAHDKKDKKNDKLAVSRCV